MKPPLEDIEVLDLSHALAGPFCSTMLLSQAGVFEDETRASGSA